MNWTLSNNKLSLKIEAKTELGAKRKAKKLFDKFEPRSKVTLKDSDGKFEFFTAPCSVQGWSNNQL